MNQARKTTQLRALLQSTQLEFLMEAHSGLSAKIAEEAGFKGIWGSGLSISAAQGARDNNELSWTQVLDIAEFMSDATTVPILLDGDTGYGNFNNMRRLVKKLEQRGIAGVCIEDKIFPKTNSFLRDTRQPLANPLEFCGKIQAGKDSQTDPDFCIVARVEAFIAGWGLQETLDRANAYYEAGADAVLIHSKLSKPDEILAFMRQWHRKCPVVIVPTKYYSTPTQVFREQGISLVIWANHLLRSSLAAMQQTASLIHSSETIIEVEDAVAPLAEVFRLQNDKELQDAEGTYLRVADGVQTGAVILAASRGDSLSEMTASIPKAMIPVRGKPIVGRTIAMLQERGVTNIAVVRGYKKESLRFEGITYFDNNDYASTGELVSLNLATSAIRGNTIISYGDILFRKYILGNLLEEAGSIVIVVDGHPPVEGNKTKKDLVTCSRPYAKGLDESAVVLEDIRYEHVRKENQYHGEWIGLMKVDNEGSVILKSALQELSGLDTFASLGMTDLLQHLLRRNIPVNVLYIEGNWLDVDTVSDYSLTSTY
jgi:phosphoenolpyruvate phosphomutase